MGDEGWDTEVSVMLTFSGTGTRYTSEYSATYAEAFARIGGLFALFKIASISMRIMHEQMFIKELR